MNLPLALWNLTPPAGVGAEPLHVDQGDHPWQINIPDHPSRTDSAGFRASKRLAAKILATLGVGERILGSEALQMHHGGSLWVLDDDGWFLLQNDVGIEWSGQFCADPARVDALRANACRLYAAFPSTVPEMARLGYDDARAILDEPIRDPRGVGRWVDSIFNACVPLPATRHVGVLPQGAGRHHYPTPITDIELVKFDDYVLWVTDPASGQAAAVVPVAPRGEGVARTTVVYAEPGTPLGAELAAADASGRALELGADQPLSRQAFALQTRG